MSQVKLSARSVYQKYLDLKHDIEAVAKAQAETAADMKRLEAQAMAHSAEREQWHRERMELHRTAKHWMHNFLRAVHEKQTVLEVLGSQTFLRLGVPAPDLTDRQDVERFARAVLERSA
jgi:hypothetical protein